MDATKAVLLFSPSMAAQEFSEGEKLSKLLKSNDKTIADLARAASVSWPAAKEWAKAETIGANAKQTVISGLEQLGIDPRSMWPDAAGDSLTELRALTAGMDVDTMRKVRRLLSAKPSLQFRMIDYLEGRIEDASTASKRK